MTKAEIIEHIYGSKEFRGAISKKMLAGLIDAVFAEVQKALRKNGRFSYPNFGTFLRRKRAGRVGRNPKTQERIRIAPRQTVIFKPHQAFKDALNPRAR
ncbi:MAG: HU family DNA-binding protein [Myxococcota bacterium]|nr:HU family DNA-binding protein [Myxococcota bacterium]